MIFPALIYASFAASGEFSNGWGIPVATDIAFALGVLALLGQRIPLGLKVFLAALAIADDLGAVAVIAIFYSHGLSVAFLLSSCFVVLLLLLGNRFTIRSSWFYAVLGVVLWCFVLKSGIHATVAGVLLAMTIPVKSGGGQSESEIERISLLERWEHTLQPLVSYLILPVFALVNTGILLQGLDIAAVFCNSVTVGIMLGLVVGKVAGVSLFVWLAVKLRIASLPSNVSMTNIFGVSWLCGIGFTMSLFIAGLAFGESWIMNNAKIGIFSASILAGIIGYVVLRLQFTSKTGAMS
jgi:NhaA family Na+:H+ antiporter